ncbi:helix-turn-helix domain-containing protein [Flintibacter muris]|uniref:helix-turn-helix domain-containing protein n=1 Tax=Flintibacter muris TaxID=2941327 RepID=UPI00203D19EA|nr:helix-turn-helix transcriptional regulator [Flintibacter muris]
MVDDIILTITERLKDLRKKRGLTLEALSEATKISRSALGTYETGEFKDISPFSIVKLAKFYGVTTDYLMGVSNLEKEADAEIQELRLTNEALNVLKGGHFSRKLLSEVICHNDFPRLMTDMEIFVDHIASMQVGNLNDVMGTMRGIVQKQYHPEENELFYRTAELGKISADEYVSSVLRDDLTGILRDIRNARPKRTKDETALSPLAVIEEFEEKVQSVIEGKGSPEEQAAKVYLAAWGIDYDDLTPEEFVVLIGILEKSKFKENSISRRGKKRPLPRKKRKK